MSHPYNTITDSILQQLITIVGEKNIITDKEELIDFSHDEFAMDQFNRYPDLLAKPGSTEEVAEIVKLCKSNNIPLTPRGAGSGLCGGCIPSFGGILITLENMTQVLEVDTDNLTATVEAGLMLMDFYPAVQEKGLFFPPHPGDESATIGGVIATNAGGARAVKYGVIRNFIKGIEMVTSNGDIVQLGGKFMKDSSGYSLMHLMIGSEGTLGIVTKATITLMPPPKVMYTLVAPYDDLHDAIATVPAIIQAKIIPMAIEFVEKEPVQLSGDFINKKWPTSDGNAFLMIIVDGNNDDEVMQLAENISEVCLENNALDVFVADKKEKQHDILEIRSNIYEAMKNCMLEILDITVPRAQIANFVDEVHALEEELDTWLPTYGHAADGNVHTHIMKQKWIEGEWQEIENWHEKYEGARKRLHSIGKKYNGIPSGEHGIGIVKKEYLKEFLSGKHIDMMSQIKKTLDPDNILNPGKIIDIN